VVVSGFSICAKGTSQCWSCSLSTLHICNLRASRHNLLSYPQNRDNRSYWPRPSWALRWARKLPKNSCNITGNGQNASETLLAIPYSVSRFGNVAWYSRQCFQGVSYLFWHFQVFHICFGISRCFISVLAFPGVSGIGMWPNYLLPAT
jgi:hypothetical protein